MAIGVSKDFKIAEELKPYTAYLIKGGVIMMTLEKGKAVYLLENGAVQFDDWERPTKVIRKLDKKNFDIIIK